MTEGIEAEVEAGAEVEVEFTDTPPGLTIVQSCTTGPDHMDSQAIRRQADFC